MSYPRLTLLLRWFGVGLFLALALLAAEPKSLQGASTRHVLDHYGTPTSRMKVGTKDIFIYPHGGRVEFQDGAVTDVTLPLPPKIRQLGDTPKAEAPPRRHLLPSDALTNSADKEPANPIENLQEGLIWVGALALFTTIAGAGFNFW